MVVLRFRVGDNEYSNDWNHICRCYCALFIPCLDDNMRILSSLSMFSLAAGMTAHEESAARIMRHGEAEVDLGLSISGRITATVQLLLDSYPRATFKGVKFSPDVEEELLKICADADMQFEVSVVVGKELAQNADTLAELEEYGKRSLNQVCRIIRGAAAKALGSFLSHHIRDYSQVPESLDAKQMSQLRLVHSDAESISWLSHKLESVLDGDIPKPVEGPHIRGLAYLQQICYMFGLGTIRDH